ncbi:glucosaminidase domain-containing protein [Candidatus Daviesbacteria bacterium]|nr:glucosaminidase domain-containing protein [Candidatus Daviesbacteria bacterium]
MKLTQVLLFILFFLISLLPASYNSAQLQKRPNQPQTSLELTPEPENKVSLDKILAYSDQQISIEAKEPDKRALILKDYLDRYTSPLSNHAQDFIEAADEFGLDWKLVPAIAGVESTFGKNIPGGYEQSSTSYNGWGWGVYGDQAIYFNSWKDAIWTVSKGLKENYIDKGMKEPLAMNRVYAQSQSWGWKVNKFMADIEDFEKNYPQKDQLLLENINLENKTAASSAEISQNDLVVLNK